MFFFIIATKSDLRDEEGTETIPVSEGKRLKRKIRAVKYMECSALKSENLKEIFAEAVKACGKTPHSKKKIFFCFM